MIGIGAAGCLLAAVHWEPTLCVRGWLYGEAFYDNRPTSYWRSVIESELAVPNDELFKQLWPPQPGVLRTWLHQAGWRSREDRSYFIILHPDAESVLEELNRDRSPRIRTFAEHAIDYRKNELPRRIAMQPPFGMDTTVYLPWLDAPAKSAGLASR